MLVVGAGLTGASAAYHLAGRGLRVAVVDAGDPASEASGRNGGHFELVPENSIGEYRGLARERLKFVRRTLPRGVAAPRAQRAGRAAGVCGVAAHAPEPAAAARARRDGGDRVRLLPGRAGSSSRTTNASSAGSSRRRSSSRRTARASSSGRRSASRAELGFTTRFRSRFLPEDGSYHPYRYACGLLDRALRRGVELYTRLPVLELVVARRRTATTVTTPEGRVVARRVVVATNAFTRELLPELPIVPFQSQVMLTEHVSDRTRGRIVTSEEGPVYFHQPRSGVRGGRAPLLFGGGDDRPLANPRSRRRSGAVHRLLLELRDGFYPELRGRPPSAEWIGPMGFTPDQLPAIGPLRPGVVVAAGFSGYGGSYTTAAGEAAAAFALTGEAPPWLDAEVFAPTRLLGSGPTQPSRLVEPVDQLGHRLEPLGDARGSAPRGSARAGRRAPCRARRSRRRTAPGGCRGRGG